MINNYFKSAKNQQFVLKGVSGKNSYNFYLLDGIQLAITFFCLITITFHTKIQKTSENQSFGNCEKQYRVLSFCPPINLYIVSFISWPYLLLGIRKLSILQDQDEINYIHGSISLHCSLCIFSRLNYIYF